MTAAQPDRLSGNADGSGLRRLRNDRPDHFSTYVARDLVRRLKVVAAIRDVPLWAVVTEALTQYLERYEGRYGRLPNLEDADTESSAGKE